MSESKSSDKELIDSLKRALPTSLKQFAVSLISAGYVNEEDLKNTRIKDLYANCCIGRAKIRRIYQHFHAEETAANFQYMQKISDCISWNAEKKSIDIKIEYKSTLLNIVNLISNELGREELMRLFVKISHSYLKKKTISNLEIQIIISICAEVTTNEIIINCYKLFCCQFIAKHIKLIHFELAQSVPFFFNLLSGFNKSEMILNSSYLDDLFGQIVKIVTINQNFHCLVLNVGDFEEEYMEIFNRFLIQILQITSIQTRNIQLNISFHSKCDGFYLLKHEKLELLENALKLATSITKIYLQFVDSRYLLQCLLGAIQCNQYISHIAIRYETKFASMDQAEEIENSIVEMVKNKKMMKGNLFGLSLQFNDNREEFALDEISKYYDIQIDYDKILEAINSNPGICCNMLELSPFSANKRFSLIIAPQIAMHDANFQGLMDLMKNYKSHSLEILSLRLKEDSKSKHFYPTVLNYLLKELQSEQCQLRTLSLWNIHIAMNKNEAMFQAMIISDYIEKCNVFATNLSFGFEIIYEETVYIRLIQAFFRRIRRFYNNFIGLKKYLKEESEIVGHCDIISVIVDYCKLDGFIVDISTEMVQSGLEPKLKKQCRKRIKSEMRMKPLEMDRDYTKSAVFNQIADTKLKLENLKRRIQALQQKMNDSASLSDEDDDDEKEENHKENELISQKYHESIQSMLYSSSSKMQLLYNNKPLY